MQTIVPIVNVLIGTFSDDHEHENMASAGHGDVHRIRKRIEYTQPKAKPEEVIVNSNVRLELEFRLNEFNTKILG